MKTGLTGGEAAAGLTVQVPPGQTAPDPEWFDDPELAEALTRLGARVRPLVTQDASGQDLVLAL